MANQEWDTDEDQLIYKLTVHRNLVGWVIDRLKSEGIECRRTTGNDASGDILYLKEEDEEKVKEIVRKISSEV